MKPQELIPLVSRALVNLAGVATLMFTAPLAWLTGRVPDGWRRTMGLGLRSEACKFGLSAFGLDLYSDLAPGSLAPTAPGSAEHHFIERFAQFLETEPDAHYVLEHGRHCVYRKPVRSVDVTLGAFQAGGGLRVITTQLDRRVPSALDESHRRETEQAIILAYNRTRTLAETSRPRELRRQVDQLLARGAPRSLRQAMSAYGRRLLASCFVSFEPMGTEANGRVLPPDFRQRRGLGFGVLNGVGRLMPNGRNVDLWMQVHHTGADGVPMQELLSRLESAWGATAPLLFPAEDPSRPPVQAQSCQTSPAERPISLLLDFIDFTPLVQVRRQLNARWAAEAGNSVTMGGLLMWCLARQSEFAGLKFGLAVDVPADPTTPRAVDLAAIRPSDYFGQPAGLVAFTRDFNELVHKARLRQTASHKAAQALALLPAWLAAKALTLNPDKTCATFGSVGLSVIKEAKVFLAPMSDTGCDGGFLAIGSMSLPSGDGRSVAAVTIKGDAAIIQQYPAALRRAIAASGECLPKAESPEVSEEIQRPDRRVNPQRIIAKVS